MIYQKLSALYANRRPELLPLKREKMAVDEFSFFRGSSPLFYEELSKLSLHSPITWICGDPHMENFGTFRGSDGAVYFDINDFDEAVLGGVHWDIIRMTTSLMVAYEIYGTDHDARESMLKHFIKEYKNAMTKAKTSNMHYDLTKGPIHRLMINTAKRKRATLLHTLTKDGKFRREPHHHIAVSNDEYTSIEKAIATFFRQDPFYAVKDVIRRIAGNGSIGLDRYLVLVEGKGGKKHYILDLKEAMNSLLEPFLTDAYTYENHAARVVSAQKIMQCTSPFLLSSISLGEKKFVMKEMQPSEDTVHIGLYKKNSKKRESIIEEMAFILASAHIRGAGVCGAGSFENLMLYAISLDQHLDTIVNFAHAYTEHNKSYYQEFLEDLDQ